jgi:hypothetical protein
MNWPEIIKDTPLAKHDRLSVIARMASDGSLNPEDRETALKALASAYLSLLGTAAE